MKANGKVPSYDWALLTEARLRAGWNKQKVAKKMRVHRSTVTRIEQGLIRNPETIKRMADVLGIEVPVIEGKR